MGENDCRTIDQPPFYGSYACQAGCLTSLAHIKCVGPAGVAVTVDRYSRYIKTPKKQGCYIKG